MAVARGIVDLACESGFNAVQFLLMNGVRMDRAPWRPSPRAWTKAQLLEWVAHIRAAGMEPIPEIKLLTHQEKFLGDRHPRLLYNAMTYDPRNEEVYTLVFSFLDEVLEGLRPRVVHIGHDEVFGFAPGQARQLKKAGAYPLPADLFFEDIRRITGFLGPKGVGVWMWGDMLLSPDEFPGMLAKHLHGTLPGYGRPLRERLSREIVICDWHDSDDQEEFPAFSRLREEGFRVVAATWKKEHTIRNFARYASAHGAFGLMATTWYNMDNPAHEALVRWIVRSSDRLFRDPGATDIEPAPADGGDNGEG